MRIPERVQSCAAAVTVPLPRWACDPLSGVYASPGWLTRSSRLDEDVAARDDQAMHLEGFRCLVHRG
jgi:hypothetical protein